MERREGSPTWRRTPRCNAEVGIKGASVCSEEENLQTTGPINWGRGGIHPSGHKDECDEKFTLERVLFLRTLHFKRGREHTVLGFYLIPSASHTSSSSHANDLQENGRYLHKKRGGSGGSCCCVAGLEDK